MHDINTKSGLVELLFKELDESEPRQKVDPSFLLRLGGICHGLILGGFEGAPPYLFDTFSIHCGGRRATSCGTKLVAFANPLTGEGCFDPARVWTTSRLIELMLAALDSNDLRLSQDQGSGQRYVISTGQFEARRGVKVRVKIGRVQRRTPAGSSR
jgi:hypothetical protein